MPDQYDDYKAFFSNAVTVRETEAKDPETVTNYLSRAIKDPDFVRSNPNAGQALKRRNPDLYRRIRDGLPREDTLSVKVTTPAAEPQPAPATQWQDEIVKQIDKVLDKARQGGQ